MWFEPFLQRLESIGRHVVSGDDVQLSGGVVEKLKAACRHDGVVLSLVRDVPGVAGNVLHRVNACSIDRVYLEERAGLDSCHEAAHPRDVDVVLQEYYVPCRIVREVIVGLLGIEEVQHIIGQ